MWYRCVCATELGSFQSSPHQMPLLPWLRERIKAEVSVPRGNNTSQDLVSRFQSSGIRLGTIATPQLLLWRGRKSKGRMGVKRKPAAEPGTALAAGRNKGNSDVHGLVAALAPWVKKLNFINYTSERTLRQR